MGTALTILALFAGVILIALVLLQPGKGDLSASFGGISGQMGSMFGMQKTATILTKLTWAMITAIVVFALSVNIFFNDRTTGEQVNPSVMGKSGAEVQKSLPPPPIAPQTDPNQ